MSETVAIQPVDDEDKALMLTDEQKVYFTRAAQEITEKQVEQMDWETGDPAKRQEIIERHNRLATN
ncbi:MAG: hypothetical protein HW405_304 [Candidatus Berkelbacteria bacterium]|nr:hypothetical protein [Candidatus Berkelbacteria bacterium]